MMVLYLGVTAHYIDQMNWRLQSVLNGFSPPKSAHTAAALAQETVQNLDNCGILRSVQAITVDNPAVMIRMITNSQPHLLEFLSKDGHVRCMAPIINLAAQQLLNHLKVTANNNAYTLIDDDDTPLVLGTYWHCRSLLLCPPHYCKHTVFICSNQAVQCSSQIEKSVFQMSHVGLQDKICFVI